MRTYLTAVIASALLLVATACGGPSSTDSPAPVRPQLQPTGPGMPVAAPDDFEIVGDEMRSTSAVYNKFFLDSVNAQSSGRWTVYNYSGAKSFVLSNTCFSGPKAWLIGGNYWNSEADDIYSNFFTVPDGTDGVRVSFYARWKIQNSDFGALWFYDGVDWANVAIYGNGQNADYPGWTKYYYELPANLSGQDQQCRLNFQFGSNNSLNDWGFAFDSISVYQRQLVAPTGVAASDGNGATEVTWDAATDPLVPEFYDIYMSDSEFGTYDYVISTPDPQIDTNENASGPQDGTVYWYKVKARKQGWPDSPFSNADSGYWVL